MTSNFDSLHPALQHHIVNSLGWRALRPFQDAVIPAILAEKHLLILAPTAGGKTEAAFFPVLSRMLSADWSALSVLYICPIKALLNNLESRLHSYSTLVGRRVGLWHGDITAASRKRLLREPPDCLLTTPESLEGMLVSLHVDAAHLFRHLQVVIVDEIHAFAGDDRGWHLLAVLERLSRLAGREVQRLGLSATLGNPQTLVDWLAASCRRSREVFLPQEPASPAAVTLDYVGSLQNAATVLARLYQGEKRLVFVDSRARAEQLAQALRQLDVTTFVTHSSLSREQRHAAEEAFAAQSNCVIVATSVLELGIDVGDLDRVVQIDAPSTVCSFLQRLGRTGRRPGARRNCLFLATSAASLVQAAALLQLWQTGYIEPVIPPPRPWHILAQQLLALILQEHGIGRQEWWPWLQQVEAFTQFSATQRDTLVQWMLEQQIVWEEQGILWFGQQGERTYGRRNFLDLCSVFTAPPLFTVRHGRHELGCVDVATFLGKQAAPAILALGGRAWLVQHLDWPRRVAYVKPTEMPGRSRWQGARPELSFRLCQAIKDVLVEDAISPLWSRRARQQLTEIRQEFAWLHAAATTLCREQHGKTMWWTFGGSKANAMLASPLSRQFSGGVLYDSFAVTLEATATRQTVACALDELRTHDVNQMFAEIDEAASEGLKFSACLPPAFALDTLQSRLQDSAAVHDLLRQPVRWVSR